MQVYAMIHKFFEYLQDGQEYIRIWPMQKQLFALFPECRIIAATQFGIKVMPAIAVIVIAVQVQFFGVKALPSALAIGIFFFSLPVQGLMWLGHRSQQPLPPSILAWYNDIYGKVKAQGGQVQRQNDKPRFKELAVLLRTAFSELDKAFTKNLF